MDCIKNIQYLLLFALCSTFSDVLAINITSQSAVDNFSIIYEDSIHIEQLFISGSDIVNLEGLSQLISVSNSVSISSTQIQSCRGLHNLETIGSLVISNNDNLSSIEDLSSATFFSNTIKPSIIITDNLQLENCTLESMCDLLSNYHFLEIIGNSGLCPDILSMHNDCQLQIDSFHSNIIFEDNFDNWNPITNNDWDFASNTQFQLLFSADSLRNKLAIYNGVLPIKLMPNLEEVDVSFDLNYSENGTAFLLTRERDEITDEESYHYRFSFNSIKDSIDRKIYIDNIKPALQNTKISEIVIYVIPYYQIIPNGIGPPLPGKFLIDNFKISTSQTISVTQSNYDKNLEIFPNPTSQYININNLPEGDLYILDMNGQILATQEISNNHNFQQDISSFANGVYFIILKPADPSILHPQVFIKN